MENTQKRPGRPLEHGQRLERVQIMITPALRTAAEAQSARSGQSISEVYREWMERGRTIHMKNGV